MCQENLLGHRGREHHCFIPSEGWLMAEQEQTPCLQGPVHRLQWEAGGQKWRTHAGDAKHAGGVLGLSTDAYSSSQLCDSLCHQ